MAVPLGLLSVRTFPQKPFLVLSELPNLSNPTKIKSTKHSKNSPKTLQHEVIQHLTPLTAALTLPFFLDPQDALAVDGELGLLEGRSFALIHPLVMGSLFFYTLYAGYLGWQWRRVRTIQNEINELKKQVKPVLVTPEGSPPGDTPVSPIETKIQQLTEERKELLKGSFKDRHFNAGSILLGFGVLESVGGGVNTYIRTGKLFPGPHLYAGAGVENELEKWNWIRFTNTRLKLPKMKFKRQLQCYGPQQQLLYLKCRKGMKQQGISTLL